MTTDFDSADSADTADIATGVVTFAEVSPDPIDVAAISGAVRTPSGGADVVFCGVVRDHDHGRSVVSLEYVGYTGAQEVLRQVAADIAAMPGVQAVAVSHRVGTLAVGEVALAAAVSCPHRAEAFAACSALVDEVKRRLPVWKRQVFADGTDEWVNCP